MIRRAPRTRAAVLRAGLLGVSLAALAACGGGGAITPAHAFFLESADPGPDAIFVARDQIITLLFNKAIDAATVVNHTVTVTEAGQGGINGSTVLAEDGTNRTLRWTPTQLYAEDRIHSVRILASLRSVDGDAPGGADFYHFRTTPEGAPPFLPDRSQLRRSAGDLVVGRQDHRATLLADGRVLITGGFTQDAATTDRAEVFSATQETFTELTDEMVSPRATHTATLLADGRVLITGGFLQTMAGTVITTASAELFDPGSNTFSALPNMTKQRTGHAAALRPDGTVLITGGSRLDGNFLTDHDDAEVFDPVTLEFTAHPMKMVHTRSSHGMVDMGTGKIVLSGGSDQDLRSEWYDLATDTFTSIGQATSDQIRYGPAMARYASGDVVVAGGDLSGTVLHIFRSGRVQNTGSGLNAARSNATASLIAPDQILVAGGIDFSRGGFLEASVDLVIEGGVGGSRTYGTELRFPHGMAYHSATVLADGSVLYAGGLNEDGTQPNLRDAFIFEVAP